MTITKEISIRDFEFWAGAKATRDALTDEQCDQIEAMLEDICYDKPMTETGLNDLFWFDADTIADWLGYEDFETLQAANDEE